MREPEMDPAAKLRLAFEMGDFGFEVMRQNFPREHPGDSEEAIDERMVAWLDHRPGAEQGDGDGLRERRLAFRIEWASPRSSRGSRET